MEISGWQPFATLGAPLLAFFVGAFITRRMERRPKLVSFRSHVAAVVVQLPDGQPFTVHTHTIVVRNNGSGPANNVRLSHAVLPQNFSVFPSIEYSVVQLLAGGADIVFPKLVAGEQVSVTYIYYPPVVASQVNTNAKSDEGFAKIISVLWWPQSPAWQRYLGVALMWLGGLSVVFLAWQLCAYIWTKLAAP